MSTCHNVKIQNNVQCYDGVTLEDGVFVGQPSCVFTNVTDPRSEISRRGEFSKTIVRRGAAVEHQMQQLFCSHDLGAYCFIAAGFL